MITAAVTLDEVLTARDRRAAAQQRLRRRFSRPVVSFTMNMPGPVKRTVLSELAFDAGIKALYRALGAPVHQEIVRENTGCEALLVYDLPAAALKEQCLRLETESAVGRLYDMDVLDERGEKLSRAAPRTCLVCGGMVTACSRSRAHGLAAVENAVQKLLRDFAAEHLSALAYDALLQEAELTPKPGLVDQNNSGAHGDMDIELFRRSAAALRPYFGRMTALGLENAAAPQLQALGQAAEAAMFAATQGVNTHKGALYSFSLLLAACGKCLSMGGDVFQTAAALARRLTPPQTTHGALVAARYGVGGVRGEAMDGFPTARRAADLLTENDPLTVLLWLMAHTDDSNVYYRSGREGADYMRRRAADILARPLPQREALCAALDAELTSRHISPGGCADLLALALFLQSLPDVLM